MHEDLLKTISNLQSGQNSLPPVEDWNPSYCGKMDLTIKANGDWIHDGQRITRKKMIKLFSSIIKKENNDYFLVTPVEKISIKVEWQPFVIIDFNMIEIENKLGLILTDNCDNTIILNNLKQMRLVEYQNTLLPIFNVRRNLHASLSRSCYYRLIESAKLVEDEKRQEFQIESFGQKFVLGNINS